MNSTPAALQCIGCHGDADAKSLTQATDETTWKSSLTHVFAIDPHTKAYDVLKSDVSKRITAHLRKQSKVEIPDAINDTRCLACHVTPQAVTRKSLAAEAKYGVSCEACHGTPDRWLTAHTTWTKETRATGIAETGFIDLNQKDIRFETCTGCHLGSAAKENIPTRDMNHDMIAAGHPRLPESMDDLIKRYPKHWHERQRGQASEFDLVKLLNAAQQRLDADRKQRSTAGDPRSPYPELAAQSCNECHQTLKITTSIDPAKPSLPKTKN